MVQGVNNYQNSINDYYKKDVSKVNKDGDVPSFLLGEESEGVVFERSGKKTSAPNQKKPSSAVTESTFSKEKVTYTPSKEASEIIKAKQKEDGATTSSFSKVLDIVKGLFQKVMNFLWYGDEEKTPEKVQEKEDEDALSSEVSQQERINAYIKKGDTSGLVDVLTQGGTIAPARNSTLITQYDRRGKIIEGNGLNTEVILKGDHPIEL